MKLVGTKTSKKIKVLIRYDLEGGALCFIGFIGAITKCVFVIDPRKWI